MRNDEGEEVAGRRERGEDEGQGGDGKLRESRGRPEGGVGLI